MVQIELVPDLSHCIETVAKREYEETVKKLIADEADEGLQQRVELLRMFLERMDFKKLRQESEKYLTEGERVKFLVYLEGGAPKYDLRVTQERID